MKADISNKAWVRAHPWKALEAVMPPNAIVMMRRLHTDIIVRLGGCIDKDGEQCAPNETTGMTTDLSWTRGREGWLIQLSGAAGIVDLVHEAAHVLSLALAKRSSLMIYAMEDAFAEASEPFIAEQSINGPKAFAAGFPSVYGTTNAKEMFAEASVLRYVPRDVRANDPGRYLPDADKLAEPIRTLVGEFWAAVEEAPVPA
jgi:hypothetical protein